MRGVEAASIGILILQLAIQQRRGRLRQFVRDAALIAVAGYLSEDVCIRLFGFYAYSPKWSVTLDRMPPLVALIWPFVILSARDVAQALRPGRSFVGLAALLVVFDAALIEPVAVRSGLWSWTEPGLWSVPLIGVWGWGVFAVIALVLLEQDGLAWLPVVAPPLANLLLVVSWWGGFRWALRAELAVPTKVAASAAASLLLLLIWRDRKGVATWGVMGPRALAASLFFALVALHGDADLWAYVVPFGLPYLWFSAWRPTPERRTIGIG